MSAHRDHRGALVDRFPRAESSFRFVSRAFWTKNLLGCLDSVEYLEELNDFLSSARLKNTKAG